MKRVERAYLCDALSSEGELERLEVTRCMDLDILVPALVPICHRRAQTSHRSLLAMHQNLAHSRQSLLASKSQRMTYYVLCLDQLDELRVLRIVDVRGERDLVHGELARDRRALGSYDLFGLALDCLANDHRKKTVVNMRSSLTSHREETKREDTLIAGV